MTIAGKVYNLRYEARRVGQTTATFENWPDLLKQMAAQKAGRGAAELSFRIKQGPTLTVPNVPGARLAVYEQFADDSYLLDEILAPLRDRPIHALDVGAHVGSFAINLTRLHPQATVECFEPSPDSARYLRRNIADNDLDARITVHEAALSDTVGTALLDDNSSGSVHNGLIRSGGRMVDGTDSLATRHTVEVPTTTFDDVVAAAKAPPVVVKLDCEGGEYPLVYASSPQSWASVERVVMEYHRVDGHSWDELGAWFAELGLHTVRHESVAPRTGTAWLEPNPKGREVRIANRTLRTRVYWAQRLVQTPRTFTNWPDVLKDMALGRTGKGPETLTFRTRTGMHIDTPNRPGARVPVYEVFADDTYRFEWFLGPLLRRPITVIDIGGHVGTFTCRLTQLHKDATVTAFEPSATTADYLRRNVVNNGVSDRVTVVQAALAAESGTAVFDDNGAGSGLNGLVSARATTTGVATEVQAVSFADAIAKAAGDAGQVDVIKIDCEGGEYDLVLKSAPENWAGVQRVVIEHHPVAGHSWSELRDFFAGVGLVVQDEDFAGDHGCVWLSRDPLPAVRA